MNSACALVKWLHHFQTFKYCHGHCSNKVLLIATINRNSTKLANYHSNSPKARVIHSVNIFNVEHGCFRSYKAQIQLLYRSSSSSIGHHCCYKTHNQLFHISATNHIGQYCCCKTHNQLFHISATNHIGHYCCCKTHHQLFHISATNHIGHYCCYKTHNHLFRRSATNHIGHHCYSTDSSISKLTVDYNNIFSDENKERVQKSLLQPQKQVRIAPKVDNPKQAGVLVPLCFVNQKPAILFMVRSKEITKHKGEVCFPGGMMDPTDEDLTYTAIRETYEEIKLPKTCVNVWGQMTQVPSRQDGGVMVTPVLATCGEINIKDLVLNPHEADAVFTCYIEDLCHLKNVGSTQFRTGRGFTLPVFHTGTPAYRVWGLTAIILHLTLIAIAPGLYKFKLRHRP